jgi:energy-coupling factor transporter ATP-binding protein EcfA2
MALTNVNLTVAPGSICALLGPTNSGKTTLLHAITGVLGSHHREAVASGQIKVGDDAFAPMPDKVLFPTVGLTLQDPYYQISGLCETVVDEISLTLETLNIQGSDIPGRVMVLLDKLGLSHLAHRKPSTLSGGELQRVALANMLVAQPPVLLLDEPSNSLDGTSLRRFASIVCALKESTTTVVADYQLDLALLTADQFIVMDAGRIIFSGNRVQFVDNLSRFRALLPVGQLDQTLRSIPDSTLRNRIMIAIGIR